MKQTNIAKINPKFKNTASKIFLNDKTFSYPFKYF